MTQESEYKFREDQPLSGWRCELSGMGESIVYRPKKGDVPNVFWRWMQYICFGNKWIKEK